MEMSNYSVSTSTRELIIIVFSADLQMVVLTLFPMLSRSQLITYRRNFRHNLVCVGGSSILSSVVTEGSGVLPINNPV
jgi:hypothetical protein